MIAEALKIMAPPKEMTLSEWADKYAYLSPESAANPGKWKSFPYQKEPLDCISDPDVEKITFIKSARIGYALNIETELPTPIGWVKMKNVKIGQKLFDENGNLCKVLYVSPIYYNHDCYKITFCDKSEIICDAGHLWYVESNKCISFKDNNYHNGIRNGVLSTEKLFQTYRTGKNFRTNYAIPVCKPIKNVNNNLKIPPYFLGLWLGDGHSVTPKITQHKNDIETAKYISENGIKVTIEKDKRYKNNRSYLFDINKKRISKWAKIFDEYNLLSGNSGNRINGYKHIPNDYLRASINDRIKLLQGLCDSDASINNDGLVEFVTVFPALKDGFTELLASLGCKYTISKRTKHLKKHYKDQYRIRFKAKKEIPPFKLKRKADKIKVLSKPSITNRRRIIKIEKTKSIPVRCIQVNSKSSLFLAGKQMIPTHNTKMITYAIGYHIDQDPCGMLVVQPTVEDSQGYSKDELAPMIRDTPKLDGLIAEAKTRDSNNTITKKMFAGGQVILTGANSARGFRRISVRKVFFDEVDGYPPTAGSEGDQIKLGSRRTDFFWNRQIILGSTPTVKGISRIEDSFEESDKRRYFVPCPYCKKKQVLKFGGEDADYGFKWEKDSSGNHLPETTRYMCEHCHKLIDYEHHRWMVENGEWIAEKPFKGHAGFHIWAAYSYSPNATWEKIVIEFLECHHDPLKLKTFVNTILGETWEDEGLKVEHSDLFLRREKYPAQVPAGGLVLVCSVDVQDDRMECEVNAYGIGQENWSVEYFVIFGQMDNQEGPWKELDNYIQNTTFRHQSGLSLKISCTTIDSGGHYTDAVYKFCKNKAHRRIFAIKGSNTPGKPLVSRPSTSNKGKVKLFTIGTDTAKEIIFSRLQMHDSGPGYIHFPVNGAYDEEYFKQLTAEKAVTVYKKGFPYREWHAIRARNEALDLKVYSLAALAILNPNFKAIAKSFETKKQELEKNMEKQKIQPKKRIKRNDSYLNRWKNGL